MTYELEHFFTFSPDLLCIFTTGGDFRAVNPVFERTLGWKSKELLSRPLLGFVHPDDREATRLAVEKLVAGSSSVSLENRCRCADGTYKRLDWTVSREREKDLLYAFARDITELNRAEERFRTAIDSLPGAMIMVDAEGKLVLLNRETERLFGYDRSELLGRSVELLLPERFRELHANHRKAFSQLPTARPMGSRRDLVGRRRDGSEFPIEVGLNPIETPEGRSVLSVIVDLSARKEAEQEIWRLAEQLREANKQLSELARTDSLTGLNNRRAFLEQLDRDVQVAHRTRSDVSVLLADVDHFKEYNDSFGHPAGDEALKAVGRLFYQNARGSDFVARYGGEEFAMILPGTDREGANNLAERFRAAVQAHSSANRCLTASLGASTMNHAWQRADCPSRLISEADRALYHSKQSGRNRVTHANDLTETSLAKKTGIAKE